MCVQVRGIQHNAMLAQLLCLNHSALCGLVLSEWPQYGNIILYSFCSGGCGYNKVVKWRERITESNIYCTVIDAQHTHTHSEGDGHYCSGGEATGHVDVLSAEHHNLQQRAAAAVERLEHTSR